MGFSFEVHDLDLIKWPRQFCWCKTLHFRNIWQRQTTFVFNKLGFVCHINQTKGPYEISGLKRPAWNTSTKKSYHHGMIQENDSENSLTPLHPPAPIHQSFLCTIRLAGGRHPKRPVSKQPQNEPPQSDLKTTSKRPHRPQNDLKTTSK